MNKSVMSKAGAALAFILCTCDIGVARPHDPITPAATSADAARVAIDRALELKASVEPQMSCAAAAAARVLVPAGSAKLPAVGPDPHRGLSVRDKAVASDVRQANAFVERAKERIGATDEPSSPDDARRYAQQAVRFFQHGTRGHFEIGRAHV